MADMLIIGMEMPEIEDNHGIKAEIRMLDGKLELGIMTGGYHCSQEWTYYPLVEIQGHGDLIDRNAFREKMDKYYPFDRYTQMQHGEADAAKSTILRMLYEAPIVIPASKEVE